MKISPPLLPYCCSEVIDVNTINGIVILRLDQRLENQRKIQLFKMDYLEADFADFLNTLCDTFPFHRPSEYNFWGTRSSQLRDGPTPFTFVLLKSTPKNLQSVQPCRNGLTALPMWRATRSVGDFGYGLSPALEHVPLLVCMATAVVS